MMDGIAINRNIIRQLQQLIEFAEPKERPRIKKILRKRLIRHALLLLQSDLESATQRDFDPIISRKLDAIEVLLND